MLVETRQFADVKRGEGPIQLRQHALDEIRTLILAPNKSRLRNSALKNLPDGTKTSERAIAEELQMSRTPVREALAVLEQLGIVEQTPQVGVRVRQISLQEAENTLRIREGVEGAAVERIQEDDSNRRAVEELQSSVDAMTDLKSDVHAFMKADTDFHRSIVRLAGFSSHVGIMQSLRDLIHLHRLQHDLPKQGEMDAIVAEHAEIVRAISAAEGKAMPAVDEHLANTLERLRRLSRSVDLVNAMHTAGGLSVGKAETLTQASPQTQKVAAAAAKY
jgi:DNA-binding GntR family transcriptional regulator